MSKNKLGRRQVLEALGLALAAMSLPGSATASPECATPRASTALADTRVRLGLAQGTLPDKLLPLHLDVVLPDGADAAALHAGTDELTLALRETAKRLLNSDSFDKDALIDLKHLLLEVEQDLQEAVEVHVREQTATGELRAAVQEVLQRFLDGAAALPSR